MEKQTVPHESTVQLLSFEWSHTRVSSAYVKVRNTTIDLMLDSGSERVKQIEESSLETSVTFFNAKRYAFF